MSGTITLCGSARFEDIYHELNKHLTLAGHAVFSLAVFPSVEAGRLWYTPEQKQVLDFMHLKKIEASDMIVVINKGQYIGNSTTEEIAFATLWGKPVYYWEHPVGAPVGIGRVEDLLPLEDLLP